MSMHGADVDALRRLAARFDSSAEQLDRLSTSVANGLRVSAWAGPVRVRFTAAWDSQHSVRLKEAAGRLREHATQLRSEAEHQERASARTSGSVVVCPKPGEDGDDTNFLDWEVWQKFLDSWSGLKPNSGWPPSVLALHYLGLGATIVGAAGQLAVLSKYKEFRPYYRGNEYRGWRNYPGGFFGRMKSAPFASNWVARPGAGQIPRSVKGLLKGTGPVGNVVAVGTSAYDEWTNSTYTEIDKRVAATAVKTAAQGGLGIGGGAAGAWAGAAVGTAILPGVGTVAGGLIGGAVGGFYGSELGGKLGDTVKDEFAERVDAVTDGLKKAKFW